MNPLLKEILLTIPAVRRVRENRLRIEDLLAGANAALHAEREVNHQLRSELAEARVSAEAERIAVAQRHQNEIADARAAINRAEAAALDLAQRMATVEAENQRIKPQLDEALANLSETRKAVLFPPGHFYSPIVDAQDPHVVKAMETELQPATPPEQLGIDEREMLRWFERITEHYDAPRGQDQPFPKERVVGRRYYYDNPAFPLADALALLAFLTNVRPRRYIEIGAGHSSCAALDINEQYLGGGVEMTFVDPYPQKFHELLAEFPADQPRIMAARLRDVPIERFAALESGDVLFIDSSHVAKTGSDVTDYMFRILPALRPGVYVHVHDIFYPFEYPRRWIAEENRSWNEAYLLRAFLHSNPRFRVLYMSAWILRCRPDLFETRMPLCLLNAGASLWMQTV